MRAGLVSKVALGAVMLSPALVLPVGAQVRGVYPLGMSATNSGVTPQSGFTYSNVFIIYRRDELKGTQGELLNTGENSVIMDMNSFIWVRKEEIEKLGGAKLSISATLPIANNSLSSDAEGAISGGGGFADSYYQPLILGWQKNRADVKAICGFLAPTGRFVAGTNDNVGSGYWTPVLASGQTFYLGQKKKTALSAFQMYEFHSTQEGTGIHPGQTLDIDYSATRTFSVQKDLLLQLGIVGYEQWQTTNKTGPNITPEQEAAHYRVNAIGFASNVTLPTRKVNLGVKYFQEFANRSGFQGFSLQIAGAITF